MMRVGITYDLRDDYLVQGYGEEETAEFDHSDTINAIEGTLHELGFDTARVGNIFNLTLCLSRNERWDMVFNIAEGLRGFGREAQVPSLLEAYSIPYAFSDPLTLSITLHKGVTKRVLRDHGLPTPHFFVVERTSDIKNVSIPFPLFAKPIAEGTGKGIDNRSRIGNIGELRHVCEDLLERFNQPVLVEAFLPGREFTAGIVGTGADARCLGVMEVIFRHGPGSDVYSFYNKDNYKEMVEYRLADDKVAEKVRRIALSAWRALGCRDAGRIDLREDANGLPQLIEVNPLAGLHPEHSDLPILCSMIGVSYKALIDMIMKSVLKRIGCLQKNESNNLAQ